MNKNNGAGIRRSAVSMIVGLLVSGGSIPALAQDDQTRAYLDQLFAEGMEALDEERFRTAVEAFSTILSRDPSLHRARLELALAYYRSFKFEEAERYAQEVLDDPATPPNVRVTILAFLAQVRKDAEKAAKRNQWTPNVSLAYFYDSNVAAGPANDVVQLQDITLRLAPGAAEKSDSANELSAGLRHTFKPNVTFGVGERVASFLWQSDGSAYTRDYWEEHAFDLDVVSFSTGPSFVVPKHWRAGIQFGADYLRLGGEDLGIFGSVRPLITWQFNDYELTLDGTYTNRNYDQDEDEGREGDYYTAGVTVGRYLLERKMAIQGGAEYIDFSADDDQFGHDGFELYLGGSFKAWQRGSVYVRGNFRSIHYDSDVVFDLGNGLLASTGDRRDEDEIRVSAGFDHRIANHGLKDWRFYGWVEYIDNDSNFDELYEYDRTQLSLGVTRDF